MKAIGSHGILNLLVILIASSIVTWSFQYFNRNSIVVIDLAKILNAQTIVASKITSSGERAEVRKINHKNIGNNLKNVITEVAGKNTLVIVAPAVMQGATDITDKVLVKLGLPANVPTLIAPLADIFPAVKTNQLEASDIPKWMAP